MIFNIIIIGGGHAGIEALFSSSKLVNKVKLITSNIETLGLLSCNPSIGGIGKSHLIKEIEILGGIIGEVSDYSRIHSKILNYKKGESVHSLRYQVDRILYKNYILKLLFIKKNIFIEQNEINKLIRFKKYIICVNKFNNILITKNIIICTGTFLDSYIYIGKKLFKFGRFNEKSFSLSYSLLKMKIFITSFKTGTPPRVDINYINYKKLQIQYSDYTYLYSKIFNFNKNIKCFIINSNYKLNNYILKNIKKSPIYLGKIDSIGPRYCPSLEDKIFKFPNNKNLQFFLEPESLISREGYLNGLSTSFSTKIQNIIIKKLIGIKNTYIIRYAYHIKYKCIDPRCLNLSLNIKFAKNIFLAGQINGTTGYEEAAAQGIIAGINSARQVLKLTLWKPKKWNSYIGVMLNDIISYGVQEPYRIFTSKSDNRLYLRLDNTLFRFINISFKLGTLSFSKYLYFNNTIFFLYKNIIKIRKIKKIKKFIIYKILLILSKYYGYIKKKFK